jgi:hypothetical protein
VALLQLVDEAILLASALLKLVVGELAPPSACSEHVEAAQEDPDHDQHDSQNQAAAEEGHNSDDDQDDADHPYDGDRSPTEDGSQK